MKICFMRGYQACDRYRPDCRKILANLPNWEKTMFPDEADVILQFFCIEDEGSIEEAACQIRYIGKLKKENAILIVAGCAANILGDTFLEFSEVNYVIQHKPIAETVLSILGKQICEEKYFLDDDRAGDFNIVVSNGCYKPCGPCNFCFNSLSRIPVKSVPMEKILEIVEQVTAEGVRKITLEGLNVANYGIDFSKDHKPLLHELIRKISLNEKVRVIDVMSVTAANMYPELLHELSCNPKVDYIEVGCQSFSDDVISKMNVGTNSTQIEDICKALSHKTFRPIFIIGHPGETEEDFQKTLYLIRKYKLMDARLPTYICVQGTPSSWMEQVPEEIIKDRFKRARELLVELQREYFDNLIGKEVDGYITYTEESSMYAKKDMITWHLDYKGHYALMVCRRTIKEEENNPIDAEFYDKFKCVVLGAKYSYKDAVSVVLDVKMKCDM